MELSLGKVVVKSIVVFQIAPLSAILSTSWLWPYPLISKHDSNHTHLLASMILTIPTHLQAFTMIQALPTILAEKWALITGKGGPTRWKGVVTNILFMPDMTNVLQTSRNPRVSTICHHPNTHQLPLSHPTPTSSDPPVPPLSPIS